MPASEQLKRIVANRKIVNPALQKIGGIILDGCAWSSSEYSSNTAWEVNANNGNVNLDSKTNLYDYVRCVLAF